MTDPLRILQLRLDGIAQTMQQTLIDTAVSPVVREGADCASALFTPQGEILAMSEAIPLLLGALPGLAASVLSVYPVDEMAQGDLFIANDPFQGGTHLPDIGLFQPVFDDRHIVALTASLLHHQDVGGMRAGSVPPDATEIHQEGLCMPPMRAGRAGRLSPEFLALLGANSRAPEIVIGDLRAQIAAGLSAADGIARVVEDHGVDGFQGDCADLLAGAEQETAERLRRLTVTTAEGTDGLDPVAGLGPCDVCVALSIEDGHLRADFTGSSPQVAAPVNCVRSGPLSAVFYGLISFFGPEALRNGGILRRIRLVLPDASVVNAARPAPVNARTNMVRVITSAVLQALGQMAPAHWPAANCGMAYVIAFSGRWPDGSHYLSTEIVAGGAGGGPVAPGAHGISTDVGNARNTPAEALEAVIPVRLISAERRRGSGGAGRFHGGDGIRRVYEALADGVSVSLRGERFAQVPEGTLGGGAPKAAAARVIRADGTEQQLPARSAPTLNTGDRLVVESCGGAGYGRSD